MLFFQKLFLKGYHHCAKTIPPISYYICLIAIIVCLGCSEECPDDPESNAPEPEEGTYVNPVIKTLGLADPSVIYYKGKYYLYPTGDSRSYDVYISRNLVDWEKGPKVFKSDEGKVWAPDVFHDPYDDQFYLYYSANYKVGVAVADEPEGDFVDQGILFENAIDAHMFLDDDGRYYLYYVDVSLPFTIYVQPMATPLLKKGDPVFLIEPTKSWENKVTEGPWIIKQDDAYYLLYSGNAASSVEYRLINSVL